MAARLWALALMGAALLGLAPASQAQILPAVCPVHLTTSACVLEFPASSPIADLIARLGVLDHAGQDPGCLIHHRLCNPSSMGRTHPG